MKRLKGKRAKGYIEAYNRATKTTLSECYSRHSIAKKDAYDFCRNRCEDENGNGFKIISYNQSFFTVAWLVANADTGALELRVETCSNSYVMDY